MTGRDGAAVHVVGRTICTRASPGPRPRRAGNVEGTKAGGPSGAPRLGGTLDEDTVALLARGRGRAARPRPALPAPAARRRPGGQRHDSRLRQGLYGRRRARGHGDAREHRHGLQPYRRHQRDRGVHRAPHPDRHLHRHAPRSRASRRCRRRTCSSASTRRCASTFRSSSAP